MKPPLPHSYWVEPGRLLAGEHPDGGSESATRARLETLVAAGVRHFIDLTQSHELAPYRDLLPEGIGYGNFPMRDHSLPESRRSRTFGDGLTRALDSSGSDRDAVCAVYGALAGAFHGEDAIDNALRGRVAGLPRLTLVADQLCQYGSARHGVTA